MTHLAAQELERVVARDRLVMKRARTANKNEHGTMVFYGSRQHSLTLCFKSINARAGMHRVHASQVHAFGNLELGTPQDNAAYTPFLAMLQPLALRVRRVAHPQLPVSSASLQC